MKTTPPLRVHSQKLSLWQSTIAGYVMDQRLSATGKNERITISTVQSHPMVIAVNRHVEKAVQKDYQARFLQGPILNNEPDSDQILVMLSELTFQIALARVKGAHEYEGELMEVYRKYSDRDPGFLECVVVYAEYYTTYNGIKKYNSWRTQGNGDLNYGKIAYKLSNDAKVAIIGDWGTGMQDAECLLGALIDQHKPDAIIHLGDIYYSGTPQECVENFKTVIDRVFDSKLGKGNRIPVFSIPGNHDYYAFGYGYYDMVTGLNEWMPEAVQLASYFCLETEDGGWQFLGMDTGFQDAKPVDQLNPFATGPSIQGDEYFWHQDKLEHSDAITILLSHHQLFSHNAKINGSESVYSAYPNINKFLLDLFQPYFGDKVAAWLWGHEHNQVIFNDNNFGLAKGRLIGASAYEEMVSADPYALNYPNAPFNNQVELGVANDYYNHGYAIIDFSSRSKPKDAVDITYYQYPSWDETCIPHPIPSLPEFMYKEKLDVTPSYIGNEIQYGEPISINLENGLDFIGAVDFSLNEYFPTIGLQAVNLRITGSTGTIKDGDTVQILTTEPRAGVYNVLGAWKTSRTLYYYKPGYNGQNWIIKKVNTLSGNLAIHENEAVYFISTQFEGQFLCPFVSVAYKGMYLSTDASVPSKWFLNKVKGGNDLSTMGVTPGQLIDTSNWMKAINDNTNLNQIMMPGSHDAGMSELQHCAPPVGAGGMTQTQSGSIGKQLEDGSRYFDIRVDYDHSELVTYHRTGRWGCNGQSLGSILDQAKEFLRAHPSETAILKFSHIREYDGHNPAEIKERINELLNHYSDTIYENNSISCNLAFIPISEVRGKMILVFDYPEFTNPANGRFRYADFNGGRQSENITVYDKYSDTSDYDHMEKDQLDKWKEYGGVGKEYLFLLSWTLTQSNPLGSSIETLAAEANGKLSDVLYDQIVRRNFAKPNIVYIDYLNATVAQTIIAYNF